ncbi:cytidine deaminase-like protein [Cadophora sp. MPI-SDFR-AT-0126]|nr:cytidine deaminase-like protein [Leotiomycetes sp. MPI-SDFR-AT-0126]
MSIPGKSPSPLDHLGYMREALDLARQSPPKPTNYRVGALLVDSKTNTVLATGYTLECEGNTHAEQSCFIKLAEQHKVAEDALGDVLPEETVLYTTVEPCFKRLSGNLPCVERIIRLGNAVKTVYVGVKEPEKFVGQNTGRRQLEDGGIEVILVEGMEKEILEVATAGHNKES